nr:cysteine-rich receptor-like protein kinase 29 [Quercus suber]
MFAQVCGDKGLYTTNSTYEANLNDVLSSISSNKETENGFYNFSFGTEPDKVYAIGLCGGNVKPDICRSCLNDSRYRLTQLCQNQKEAIGWNDNCMLRFSNRSIFGIMETQPLELIITKSVSDLSGNKQLQPLFDSMKSEAASGTSRKFATRNLSTIYVLVQCTPDLLEAACSDCLDNIYLNIPDGTEVGRFYTPSCNYRFESYSSPPPPLSASPLPSPIISPTKGLVKSSQRDTVVGEGREKLGGDGVAAAVSYNQANPKEQECNGNGQGDNLGNIQDKGINVNVISAHVETDVEGLAPSCMRNCSLEGSMSINASKVDLTLHGKGHVIHGKLEHVDGVNDGIKDIKTRPKWTRLARMTDGHDSSSMSEPNTLLGKRGVQQREEHIGAEAEERTSK